MTDEAFLSSHFTRHPAMVSRQIADEHVLVPIRQHASELGDIYALNELAGFVWERLDGSHPARDILSSILDEYDVTPEQAQRDLIALIMEFEALGAAERVDG